MRKVNQENKTEEDKSHSADQGEVLPPYLEEGFGDEECQDHEGQPYQDFGPQ